MCAPAIDTTRIQYPSHCPPMETRRACEKNIGYFVPDNQTVGNSDAFFHCLALAGAEVVSWPQDSQTNASCPDVFHTLDQFAGTPPLNHGNDTAIDPGIDPVVPATGKPAPSAAGPIVGVVIGSLAGAALLGLLCLVVLRKVRNARASQGNAEQGFAPLTLVNNVLRRTPAGDANSALSNKRLKRLTSRAGNAEDTQAIAPRQARDGRIPVRPRSIAESRAESQNDVAEEFELQPVHGVEIV